MRGNRVSAMGTLVTLYKRLFVSFFELYPCCSYNVGHHNYPWRVRISLEPYLLYCSPRSSVSSTWLPPSRQRYSFSLAKLLLLAAIASSQVSPILKVRVHKDILVILSLTSCMHSVRRKQRSRGIESRLYIQLRPTSVVLPTLSYLGWEVSIGAHQNTLEQLPILYVTYVLTTPRTSVNRLLTLML